MDSNTFYRHAVEALTGSLNLHDGLKKCIQFLTQVMPSDVLSVHLWDENLCSLRIISTADIYSSRNCDIIIPIEESCRHIPRWEHENNIKVVGNYHTDPISIKVQNYIKPIYGTHTYSHMICRVKIEDERICDIALLARGENRFTQHHAELFSSLNSPFGIAVSNSLKHLRITQMHSKLLQENQQLKHRIRAINQVEVIGRDHGLKYTMQQVESIAPTDAPVLILGETGVGKDVIANAIQASSTRSEGPYIRLNCGAIPESLIDSELFGHEKGAFTGATERQMGRFERADKGTLFLDEIGELSRAAQVKLLRVLQNGELERIGGNKTIKVDVRIIAATNSSLQEMVNSGRFRADLYYRLCLFPITIPPLRERLEDIPLFINHFISLCCDKLQLHKPDIADGEMAKLLQYHWPGNVRELANIVERALINCRGDQLLFDAQPSNAAHVQPSRVDSSISTLPIATLNEINKQHIEKVLVMTKGKIQGENGAAELLEINPHTLRSRIKKLGIHVSS
ncbi:sigma-54 interaction domain-containing protein [Vibrio hippocampi]|uniref:Anaerobic nitric oxide reductase transcription regulator NorR n=1 Tax=Vibrio hippocampi TaxID=654686 RepID=A0ABM8ZM83_9VIBR|nr:sigma-54 dependent transcriptional regulator [Vibrio hippocampi]CAH0529516.1 Anaerobic nitric oxide reductase transcription regulator NorR [Vibrio hippocampi]